MSLARLATDPRIEFPLLIATAVRQSVSQLYAATAAVCGHFKTDLGCVGCKSERWILGVLSYTGHCAAPCNGLERY
jgi:hypothetical protein